MYQYNARKRIFNRTLENAFYEARYVILFIFFLIIIL